MTVFRDLSQHILDIAENGIQAGATVLHIKITEDLSPEQDTLTIAIQDNGRGMDALALARVTDPWFTTRTTRKVGLGIPFFRQTAEMCEGRFEIFSTVGQGTLTQATFRHSHIDRPPLGDVGGTILCLIVGFPDGDVVYCHDVNEKSFMLNTHEIRQVLGDDIPFSDPEVLTFLRQTLEEGEQSLAMH
ncbi:MAG TPA: ATP-binding protein [Anaerolineae bacterium]|nr:ATP-binding protein [Anaerolineae bacterium]